MAKVSMASTRGLDPYLKCPKCRADLKDMLIGGVGKWQTSIQCRSCGKVQKGLSFRHIIIPLVAEKYGISESAALNADLKSQEEYEHVILGGDNFDDLPAVTLDVRWLCRRKVAAGEEFH